jgi:hypothetical protein
VGQRRRAAFDFWGIKVVAEELGILGGIGEGHCCGDEWVAGKGLSAGKFPERHTSGAKAHVDSAGLFVGVKTPTYQSRPAARTSFSAACKALVDFWALAARDPDPDTKGAPVVPWHKAEMQMQVLRLR